MNATQAKDFRVLAIGYAVLREMVEEAGPIAVRTLTDSFGPDVIARSIGKAALAAVNATDGGKIE